MRVFLTLTLCMTLTFAHTHTTFELTPQKAAGAAIITVAAGGILYLVKSQADKTQRLESLSQHIAEVKDATQTVIRTYGGVAQFYYELGFIAGRINNTAISALFDRLITYSCAKVSLPNPQPIVSQ